jgi:RNA polymerase sigma factor (sigma-70 family)
MNDQDIVDRIRLGDETAVSHLYNTFFKMGTNIITRNNGNDDDARDIYQEAVVILWRRILDKNFILSSKLSTFFYSICRKLWLKELNRRSKYENSSLDIDALIDDIRPSMENTQIKQIIRENLNNLSESDRQILFLFYIENKTMDEISNILGYSNPDSAKVKKFRAKEALSELIKSKYKLTDFID